MINIEQRIEYKAIPQLTQKVPYRRVSLVQSRPEYSFPPTSPTVLRNHDPARHDLRNQFVCKGGVDDRVQRCEAGVEYAAGAM